MKQIHHIIIIAMLLLSQAAWGQQPLALSVEQCRELALAGNEYIKKANNDYLQSELDKAIAFTNYLPKLDGMALGGTLTHGLDIMGMKLEMQGVYMAGINLTQPVFMGGKIIAANRLAKIGRDCAKESLRKTRAEVIAEAEKSYWTLIAVRSKVNMLYAYQSLMDSLYAQIHIGLEAGMCTEAELLRIEAKRSEISYQLQSAKSGANLCRLALCNVIGCSFDTEIVPSDTIITITPPATQNEGIEQRPEYHLLENQIRAYEQQIKIARSELLPKVGLSASYMYHGGIDLNGAMPDGQGGYLPFKHEIKDGNWSVFLSVSVPLFHWGENQKKVKKAKLDLNNAQLDFQKNIKLMTLESHQAIQNVNDSYTLVHTATTGQRQADENLRVMTSRYSNGLCTLTDLLEAQSTWQQAQSNIIEAKAQYKIHQVEYLKAIGKLE
ncbi:TolC family protein [Palleniella muris]|uniref:TolC family protein n=1 Tax=Palleniella muris TaxID=3038145 RepID=A0AC61QQB5_9BACT|nr:TolC family protein [Palleniella muris]TGX82333.1 TolC family protein [Palleniella muris]